jgi:outer membrane protein OmpA-like peptidoglycan-associated protein
VSARILAAIAAIACLAGCAQQALVVVFPDADGHAGAVTLADGTSEVLLDKPYAAGEIRSGKARAADVKPDEAQKIFSDALAAQPMLPAHFVLYFLPNSDRLTTDSEERYREMLEDVRRRPVPEVEAIGHTDTVGTQESNQRLSLQRAVAVREQLKQDGVTAPISVAGRGKLDPAVPTADQVDEPRNRRVVITVR